MDPVTALGLAANVFACISFASDLIKGTIEISTSPHGCSAGISKLDSIYNDLQVLCIGLDRSTHQQISAGVVDDQIKRLSHTCEQDCKKLLQVLSKLKTKVGSKGKWESFRVAMRTVSEKKSMEELEKSISVTQQALTTHICALTNLSYRAQSSRVEELLLQSIQLQSDQEKRLENITKGLEELKTSLPSQLWDSTFSPELVEHNDPFNTEDLHRLQRGFQSLSLLEQVIVQEQSILQSLTFESRPIRHEQFAEAHAKTFQWALVDEPHRQRNFEIGEWLRSGNGIFWVSGKPGSGKSTLMKFMANSPITSDLVCQWAKSKRALIVSHYFWIAGTPMQKSYQGLLQTSLFDIFRQSPSLIPKFCSAGRLKNAHLEQSWSRFELRETLEKAPKMNPEDQSFCFFIDGMDEFNGDHEAQTELCQTFKKLATSKNIKFVLSSRPWNIFEEQFGSASPKLYMQDLTHDDIQTYVQSSLEEHPRRAIVSSNDPRGHSLVSGIIERSQGVFLWVYLVTKLLKEGLTNRDSLFDLHRRLESFPIELEPFFKTILDSVEPFYHSHMATALQITIQSGDEPLGVLAYHFHNQEYENMDYAVSLPVGRMGNARLREIEDDMSWHLNSRTRGLLEIHYPSGTVSFLHRSARDFLRTQEMHNFLIAKVSPHLNFNPVLSLLRAFLALIKTSDPINRIKREKFAKYSTPDIDNKSPHRSVLRHLWDALNLARLLDLDGVQKSSYYPLLDELDRSLLCLLPKYRDACSPSSLSRVGQVVFREQLADTGLFDYIHSKLRTEPTYLKETGSLLLARSLAMDPDRNSRLKRRGTEFFISIAENQYINGGSEDLNTCITHWVLLLSDKEASGWG